MLTATVIDLVLFDLDLQSPNANSASRAATRRRRWHRLPLVAALEAEFAVCHEVMTVKSDPLSMKVVCTSQDPKSGYSKLPNPCQTRTVASCRRSAVPASKEAVVEEEFSQKVSATALAEDCASAGSRTRLRARVGKMHGMRRTAPSHRRL